MEESRINLLTIILSEFYYLNIHFATTQLRITDVADPV